MKMMYKLKHLPDVQKQLVLYPTPTTSMNSNSYNNSVMFFMYPKWSNLMCLLLDNPYNPFSMPHKHHLTSFGAI